MTTQLEARLAAALGTDSPGAGHHDGLDGLVDSTLAAVGRRTTRSRVAFLAAMPALVLIGVIATAPLRSGTIAVETVAGGPLIAEPPLPGPGLAPEPDHDANAAEVVKTAGFGDVVPGLIADALPAALVVFGLLAVFCSAIVWIRKRRVSRPLGWVIRSLLAIAMVIVAAVSTFSWTFDVYYIPSGSMTPTVDVGDRVLTSRGDASPGDIVIFDAPFAATGAPGDLIKRLVAVEGDTVEALGSKLLVNGEPVGFAGVGFERLADFGPIEVAPGQVFVLGDNHAGSTDSRSFGTVAADSVTGIVRWASSGLPAFSGLAS